MFGTPERLSWKVLTIAVIFVCATTTCEACFISDCARGGKRSPGSALTGAGHPLRQCISCGSNNSGHCIGPSICCGDFGCYFGTQETAVCQEEKSIPVPCESKGTPCGEYGHGNCVADKICCEEYNCSYDANCTTKNDGFQKADSSSSTAFKRAFKDLLEDKIFSAMNARRR
ncbi:vasotocin precursor [Saccoglossus kowalevskii]|uniref:Vasotocin n=1 Tax=Saccoglossus kowalevskii TaxID=10224 RepID=D1LXH6_SACKO|nr:vasotocin precursor [Saccoglossus kowalevskii]ACY92682.1 vasotocin [Saccoglossus kowalevskii]